MAAKLTFKFKLEKHIGVPAPSVVIYVDVNGNGKLEAAEKVDLTQKDLVWTGTKDLTGSSSAGIDYVVWFRGMLNVGWTLEVRSDKPGDHVVSQAAAKVVSVPESFPGECTA